MLFSVLSSASETLARASVISLSLVRSDRKYRSIADDGECAGHKRCRDRKKRGERLVNIRLTQGEIEKLAARGYVVEPGFPLAAVVEAFVSDLLAAGGRNPP